jgi:hypothetical protein
MSLIRVKILPVIELEQLISCLDNFKIAAILTQTANIYYYYVSRTRDYINFGTVKEKITNI